MSAHPTDQRVRQVLADVERVNRELDLAAHPGYTPAGPRPADQRGCRSRSVHTPRGRTKDLVRHTPRSRHTCGGVTLVLVKAGRTIITWRPDRVWACWACRAWLVQRDLDHYLRVVGDTPVSMRRLDASAWRTRHQALRRAGTDWLRIPQPGGQVLVVAADPAGRPLDPRELQVAIAAKPEGKRITASGSWQLKADAAAAGAGAGAKDTEYVGITYNPVDDCAEAARQQGLYRRPLPGLHETHELVGLTSRYVLAIGMRRIDRDRGRWRWAGQAA